MKGSLNDLMKQAQEMQQKMLEAKEEVANREFEGQAGAGLVRVTMTGRYDVRRVQVDDSVLGEDKEMLEDLLAAAVNDAVKKVEASNQDMLGNLMPAGFKMPF
ncbi:MAG: YbaB/EbfC family nucleoid-associated protein [Halieaceae bacterium]|nr:YbaB/EbfC family nucleoid-associated protein [Halieaceae bacterium]